MKANKALTCGSILVLAISGSSVLADPPGKERWDARKAQMEYEREQAKRGRELEREERKYYQELEREERKRQREVAREERQYQEETWEDGGYTLGEPGYEYAVDGSYEPEYIEDKVYRIIKQARDLNDAFNW